MEPRIDYANASPEALRYQPAAHAHAAPATAGA
jgi:hypothetical protein